jgi:hypothetical protein
VERQIRAGIDIVSDGELSKQTCAPRPSASGRLCFFSCMKHRVGRCQRQCRRAFIASNGAPIRMATLMEWCFPQGDKREYWRWTDVARSARRFGVQVRKGWWQANPELLRQIKGK